MSELIELRCTCKRRGKHPLLGKASGSDFVIEIKCPHCKRAITFRYPHPLGKPLKVMAEGGGIEPLTLITSPRVSGPVADHSAAPSAEGEHTVD
jgi:phage FluMu protein Com